MFTPNFAIPQQNMPVTIYLENGSIIQGVTNNINLEVNQTSQNIGRFATYCSSREYSVSLNLNDVRFNQYSQFAHVDEVPLQNKRSFRILPKNINRRID